MGILSNLLATTAKFSSFNVLFYTGLLLLVTLFLINFSKRRQKVKLIEKIPGPSGHFLLGVGLEILNQTPKELMRLFGRVYCSYGSGISKIWIGFKPYVFLNKAETAEVILSSQKHITKDENYDLVLQWLGTGLLTSTGSKWHSRRKMLTPAFHFKILEDFVPVFNSKAKILSSKFQKHLGGGYFNIFNDVTLCTLDVILETAMGISMNVQEDQESDYVNAVLKMSDLIQKRVVKFYLQNDLVYKLLGYQKLQDEAIEILHSLSNRLIRERRAEYRKKKSHPVEVQGKKRQLAFLDLLVEAAEEHHNLSDEDIREEVDTFVFEGHDTTAAAVSFSIYLIGCHPEIQTKVHQELDSIFGGSDRPATPEDIKRMKYLECCIKEALRIFPSVPFIGRRVSETVAVGGYTLPAETTVIIVPYKIHKDPEYFPNPEKFIPERFLPENSSGRNPFAYIPFSAGPRNCIGQKFALMEEKVIVSSIYRKLRVECLLPQEELVVLGQLIMRPETSIDIRVSARESEAEVSESNRME